MNAPFNMPEKLVSILCGIGMGTVLIWVGLAIYFLVRT